MKRMLPILQVGDVLLSPDILTEYFACDYEKCRGVCCVEGDAGAPVSSDEIGEIETSLDEIWGELSAQAQAKIDQQGVAYVDEEGDLVTNIVGGRECVFASHVPSGSAPQPQPPPSLPRKGRSLGGCWLCLLEKAYREGRTKFCKPISCALYPIRAKQFGDGTIGLNYNRWAICRDAVAKGRAEGIRVFQFLREPLIRRFGTDWYRELETLAKELNV